MSALLLIPLALIAGTIAYHAIRRLFIELEQAFDIPMDTHADPDTLGATDSIPGDDHRS